mgnify:CR=1 FL=1
MAGVKGMKWGVRNANPGYSEQQQKRDVQVYGKRGAKRVNKAMNKGDQISTARGVEKTRRDQVLGTNKYVRQGGKIAGTVAGVAVGRMALVGIRKSAYTDAGVKLVANLLGSKGQFVLTEAANNPVINIAVMAGAAKVGNMLAGDIAVKTRMRAKGYNPNRR